MMAKNALFIILAALVFLTALGFAAWMVTSLSQASLSVINSHRVIDNLDRLNLDVLRTEADIKSYGLSKEEQVQATMNLDRRMLAADIARAERFIAKNTNERPLLSQLRGEEAGLQHGLSWVPAPAGRGWAAGNVNQGLRSESPLLRSLRNTCELFRQKESAVLEARINDISRMNVLAMPILSLLAGSGVMLLIASMQTSRSALRREAERADELQRANAHHGLGKRYQRKCDLG
jgi:hypothetical protein